MAGLVKSFGVKAALFESGAEFLAATRLHDFLCAIVDVHMPILGGLDVQRRLADADKQVPLILVTAFPDDRTRAQAVALGALGFLAKPVDNDQLFRLIVMAQAGGF